MRARKTLSAVSVILVGIIAGCAFDIADEGAPAPANRDVPTIAPSNAEGGRLVTPPATYVHPTGPTCDPEAPFGVPSLVKLPVRESDHIVALHLFPDGLSASLVRVFNSSERTEIEGYLVRRSSLASPFTELAPLGLPTWLNVTALDERYGLSITGDGLRAYYSITEPGGVPQMVTSSRSTTADAFGAPVVEHDLNVPGVNAGDPFVREDGRVVYFIRDDRTFRGVLQGEHRYQVEEVPEASPASSGFHNLGGLVITPDDLTIYFWSTTKAEHSAHVTMARRASVNAPFEAPRDVTLTVVGGTMVGWPTYATADNCRLYFNGGTNFQNYVAERPAR